MPNSDGKEKSEGSGHSRAHKLLEGLTTVQKVLVGLTGTVIAAGALIATSLGIAHEFTGQNQGGPSPQSSPTPGHPSLTSTLTPSGSSHAGTSTSGPQTPDGTAEIVRVTDATGRACIGSTIRVDVNITSKASGNNQIWLMAVVAVPGGEVYIAKAELDNVTGSQSPSVELINSTVGSMRNLVIVSANDSAEFSWLRQNQQNDGNSNWDINRRNLHGTSLISNPYTVKRTC
jgi:hypothetical protein